MYNISWFAFKNFEFLMDRDDPRTSLNTISKQILGVFFINKQAIHFLAKNSVNKAIFY